MVSKDKKVCEHCGQSINSREISLINDMVTALTTVIQLWCVPRGVHEFSRKEVKHLFKNDNQVARFGDWVFFGGIVYKRGKGLYGVNKERAKAFYAGTLEIPIRIKKTPGSDELTVIETGTIHDVRLVPTDSNGNFVAQYHD